MLMAFVKGQKKKEKKEEEIMVATMGV